MARKKTKKQEVIAPPIWEQAAALVEQNIDLVVEYIKRDTFDVEVPDVDDEIKIDNCYRKDTRIKSYSANIFYTELQLLEWIKCSRDYIYFLKKYGRIITLDEGIQPFELYDYQEKEIQQFEENRFSILLQCRQSGKTSVVAGYILPFSIFNQEKTTAILANKASQAREIVKRIRFMFENLPWFLQPGVTTYNKGSLGFANDSVIISASSSNDSIRGMSISLLYMDEFAFIANEQEFYESTYPVITAGKTTKVIISSTPKGARGLFYNLWQGATAKEGSPIKNEYVPIKITWRDVPGRDEEWAKITRANMTETQWQQEMEANFLGSQNTLIPFSVLENIGKKDPLEDISMNEEFDIYEEPDPNRIYFMTVDTSRGLGGDYSALVVYDITEIPFKVVAKYKNNKISTLFYPSVIYNTALHYNECEVLVEINDAGGEVVNKLYYEYEYENVLITSKDGNKMILGDYGVSAILGLRTTKPIKAIGCSNTKVLIEKEKLILNDADIIDEFTTFVQKGDSYEAEEGSHDDLAMNIVLFAWASTQEHFKQNYDLDVRKRLEEEAIKREEESLLPFGFIESSAYNTDYYDVSDYTEIVEAKGVDPDF